MRGKPVFPGRAGPGAAGGDPRPGGTDRLRDLEGRMGPAKVRPCRRDLLGAKGRAVNVVSALLVGRAKADDGAAGDQAGARVGAGGGDRIGDFGGRVPVTAQDMPARGGEARHLVGRCRQVGIAVDGDAVVVPKHHKPAKAEVPGKVDRLVAYPLHQAAVTGDHPGHVVDQVGKAGVGEPFGQRHADGGGDALAKGAGRDLDAPGVPVFGVAGGAAAQLPEGPDLIHAHVVIAQKVMDRVKQHRPVPRRQDETVAVRPAGRGGIERHETVEKDGRHVGHAHRHSGVAGIRGLHRIHRKRAQGIGHGPFVGGGRRGVHRRTFQRSLRAVETRRSISGVRISCIARSCLLPGMTMEFARLIHEPEIIEVR